MSDFIRKMPWDELAKENANLLAENEWLRNRGRKINRPKEGDMPSITIGRIVHFVVTHSTADAINKRRDHAYAHMNEHRERADGSIIHVGHRVYEGDEFPMVVTRVWNERERPPGVGAPAEINTYINGQLLLDGNDTYWLTSVYEGEGPGYWHWPEEADDE